jgi:glycosyltransferase involved in cell wall biosynthesis
VNPGSRTEIRKIIDYFFYLLEYIPITILDFLRLQKLFREISPDILHINNGGFPGAHSCRVAVLAAKSVGIKSIVFVVNNMAAGYRHPYRWIDLPLDVFVAKNVSFFITGSTIATNRLRDVLDLKVMQLKSFPNGISVREPSESRIESKIRLGLENFDGVIFGVIGVMETRKGHIHLLHSLLKFTSERSPILPPFVILIEGEGGVLPNLQEFVETNKLGNIVRFIGVESQIFNLLSLIDVLIYPAIQDEDFPNVISESMALSKAVISTKVSGATDQIINGQTGILVDIDSEEQLAEAIEELTLNATLRREMGDKGRVRYLNNYTSELALDNYMALYRSMLGNSEISSQ